MPKRRIKYNFNSKRYLFVNNTNVSFYIDRKKVRNPQQELKNYNSKLSNNLKTLKKRAESVNKAYGEPIYQIKGMYYMINTVICFILLIFLLF